MSEEHQPPSLNYRSPDDKPPGSKGLATRRFFMGLAGGTLFSGIVWFVLFELAKGHGRSADFGSTAVFCGAFVVPILKIGAAVSAFRKPGWKNCGAGILLSLILGLLIFLGMCGVAVMG